MPFGRLSKTSHDQRIFKPLNQGTRLVVMDPAVDPYNSVISGSVYDPQSGSIRGSLTDTVREMRRFEEASRHGRSKKSASESAPSGEKQSAKTDSASRND